jgi:hypothetical protein
MPESAYQFCENATCAQEVYTSFFKDKNHRFLKNFLSEIKNNQY